MTETNTETWRDQLLFYANVHLKAYKNDSLIFERSWQRSISRQM